MSWPSEPGQHGIAFFSPQLMSGGTQRHLLEVLRLLDRERFLPFVVSVKSGGPLTDAVRACGVDLFELGLGPSMLSRDVARCVREASTLLRQRATSLVQYFEWRSGVIALAAARLARGVRVVAGRRSARRERGLQGLIAEIVVHAADSIVVNAESLRPAGRARARTEVIPSGVDTDRFRVREERSVAKVRLGVPGDRPLIGTVGRLEARKGTATLIEAVARLRRAGGADVLLAVVGDGPLRAELSVLVERLGIREHVRMLGDQSDVRDVLSALDVFVLPSRTEGMSNALLEAMAMERAVVATAVGGNCEVVADGANGLLVPSERADAMAAAIARLIHDRELALRLGAMGRQTVEARYGSRAMVRRLEAVYATVAAGAHVASRAAELHA